MKAHPMHFLFFLVVVVSSSTANSQQGRKYDAGFRNIPWGTSLEEAIRLVRGKQIDFKNETPSYWRNYPVSENHTIYMLSFGEKPDDKSYNYPIIEYFFLDSLLYKVELRLSGMAEKGFEHTFYDAMRDELTKSYGSPEKVRYSFPPELQGLQWQNKRVSIIIKYFSAESMIGTFYNYLPLEIVSAKLQQSYDHVEESIDKFKKEQARKIIE